MLEAEAQSTPIMLPEVIMRSKGERIKAEKQPIPLVEIVPEGLSVNKERATMEGP